MLSVLFIALAITIAAMGFSQDMSLVQPMQFAMGAFLAVSGLRELQGKRKPAAYILFTVSGMCIVLGIYLFIV